MKLGQFKVGSLTTMFNVVLMLLCGISVSQAQQFDSKAVVSNADLASAAASAAVIQAAGSDKRLRSLNGVTSKNGAAAVPPVYRSPMTDPNVDMVDESAAAAAAASGTLDNLLVDEEDYWREVKAIIGGVLGFWGGVGGLGTMFLVVVLSQRYCCRKDDDKDDGDG